MNQELYIRYGCILPREHVRWAGSRRAVHGARLVLVGILRTSRGMYAFQSEHGLGTALTWHKRNRALVYRRWFSDIWWALLRRGPRFSRS